MVNIKVCKSCDVTKEISEFQKRKDSKDGYRNDCKLCRKNIYPNIINALCNLQPLWAEENLKKSNKFK